MARSIACSVLLLTGVAGINAQEQTIRHSFQFRDMELRSALDSLMQRYRMRIISLEADVAGRRTSAECTDCRAEEALRSVLRPEGLTWSVTDGQVIVQRAPSELARPSATLAGIIRDYLTGEGVIAASVLLISHGERERSDSVYRWCSTNGFGYFALRNVRPGDYVLHVRRLGYGTRIEQVHVEAGANTRDVTLIEQGLVQQEVTIEGERSAFSALASVSRGVYVRATPSDQNQYMLEGARIYNPVHFGGIMSAFNGDALRDVQALAGGVPPYYGGRIGGILDVSLRDGSEKEAAGIATIGSLGSSFLLEGPALEKTTFVLSGRHGYPDILFPHLAADARPSDQRSVEVIGKVTRHLSNDQRLSMSMFFGDDFYNSSATDDATSLTNKLQWNNAVLNLRWAGVVTPSLFFQAAAVYTRYGFDASHRLGLSGMPGESFPSSYRIEDIAFRAHAEYFYDAYHTALAGVELVRHRMEGRIDAFSSQIAPMAFDGISPWELAVYVQDQWRLVPSVLAEIGARATSFLSDEAALSAVDPRFSLSASLSDDLRLTSSFSAVTQFIHPYRNSGVFLFYPSIFFYPSTDKVQPSTSLQVSLALEQLLQEDQYRLALEAYYRTSHRLHEFMYDSVATNSLTDALLMGEGEVYGAEVTLEKRVGALRGLVRYGYSWASNTFAELNGGAAYRPRFDRRHELFLTLTYAPSTPWTLGAVGLLTANRLQLFEPSGLSKAVSLENTPAYGSADRSSYAEPYDLNGARLPGFQRLELWVTRTFSAWGMPMYGTLRMLNGYSLTDPFVWSVRNDSDVRLRWRVAFDAPPLLPLYPVVSVGVRF